MLPQSGDYETGNANLDRLDSRTLQWTPEGLLEAPADWLPWSPNPCKTSCAFLPAHTEAPKSLASPRKFLSGCLLITFSVYISLPFIQGNSASSIYREPLQSSRFWCGWGPAGENIPQGPSLWGFWQWSHPSKLDRGPLISVLKGWRQRLPRNPRSSVNEANGSRWPQWTWETRVSRNWVFTKYWGWKWSPATEIELDTTGKDAIFRRDLALVKSREKNKTHFSGFPTRGTDRKKKNRKKKKKARCWFAFFKPDPWKGLCGFVLSHDQSPHSAAARGWREVQRKKITLPGFMFYWKEALDELNSHGLQEWDTENI